jgi:hypothetical protein
LLLGFKVFKRLGVGRRELETANCKPDTGDWSRKELETANCKPETGAWGGDELVTTRF